MKPQAKYMRDSFEYFKSKENEIIYFYVSSQNEFPELKGFTNLDTCYTNEYPSVNHADCLNMIHDNYDKLEVDIIVICECDVIINYQSWDKKIIEHLNDNDYFGVTLSQKDKIRGNDWNKEYPCVYFLCGRKETFMNDRIDFSPDIITHDSGMGARVIKNNGKKSYLDTGYKIMYYCLEKKFFVLKNIFSYEEKTQIWFYNDIPFAFHFTGIRLKRRRKEYLDIIKKLPFYKVNKDNTIQ